MKNIYKYYLNVGGTTLSLPRGSRIVHVGVQNSGIYIWVEHDLSQPTVVRTFHVYGTGDYIEDYKEHVGTVFMGDFVWHVYEYVPF